MKIEPNILADIIEKGLMEMRISSIKDIGVLSEEDSASVGSGLDYMHTWAFLNGEVVDLCLEADAIKNVVKVDRSTTDGFECKYLFGDVEIFKLDIIGERE